MQRGAILRFQARGASMSPFVKDGDILCIAPLTKHRAGTGRIVAFIAPGKQSFTVHRIVAHTRGHYLIKGDNHGSSSDGWVPAASLLGVVRRIERNGVPIRLGLGFERYLIALLSRRNWLLPLRRWLKKCPLYWGKRIDHER